MTAPLKPTSDGSGQGYDRIATPTPDGSLQYMTRLEFENLPLSDRIKLMLGGSLHFFRGDTEITAREALHEK